MRAIRLLGIAALGLALTIVSTATVAAQGGKSSDLLTPDQVKSLVATANTPADHLKLSRHFAAEAAQFEAAATAHDAVAAAYRRNPMASESKRPGAPDTALHCDRLGQLSREAAKEARAMSVAHEHMGK